jgi:hypothetical protein
MSRSRDKLTQVENVFPMKAISGRIPRIRCATKFSRNFSWRDLIGFSSPTLRKYVVFWVVPISRETQILEMVSSQATSLRWRFTTNCLGTTFRKLRLATKAREVWNLKNITRVVLSMSRKKGAMWLGFRGKATTGSYWNGNSNRVENAICNKGRALICESVHWSFLWREGICYLGLKPWGPLEVKWLLCSSLRGNRGIFLTGNEVHMRSHIRWYLADLSRGARSDRRQKYDSRCGDWSCISP